MIKPRARHRNSPVAKKGKSPNSGGTGAGGDGSNRQLKVRVKTARGRKTSSTRWLQRQLNDPYVAAARRDGYRSRAAYKLIEMDDRYQFLKPGSRVVDLGAAPGGWCQVAVKRVGDKGQVVGIDIQEVESIPGAEILLMDFLEDEAPDALKSALNGPADVVMSDMAAFATGHKQTDHLKIMALCETALDFAEQVLAVGGTFCAKVLRGGAEADLVHQMRRSFTTVRHVKPKASRDDSSEMYVLAIGFRGTSTREGD